MKMTLTSQTIQQPTTNNERQQAAASASSPSDNRSTSQNSSPRGSPKPSPRPQTKKDQGNRSSDGHLSGSYKENCVSKQELQTTVTDGGSLSLPRVAHSTNELSVPEYSRQDSANSSVKDQKVASGSRGTKKKSAWYSSLYPTYKSRSEEFKKTFKDMPDDERLVVDYSCAMQKEILVHGRLYVSQNHLCFYANIFGWETNVTVKWRDVTAITKEKTALVIPNAVLVSTRQDKYFLTSFVARDKTYLMLFRIWQNVLMDKPMVAKEMWHLVHQCYGEELGLTSDDEDYVSPSGGDDEKHSGRFSVESLSEDCASNIDVTSANVLDQLVNDVKPEVTQPIPIRAHQNNTAESHNRSNRKSDISDMNLPTDMSDTSDSDGEKAKALGSLSVATKRHEQHDNITINSPSIDPYNASHTTKITKRTHKPSRIHPHHVDDSSPSPPDHKHRPSANKLLTSTPKTNNKLSPITRVDPPAPFDYDNQFPDDHSRSSSDEKLYPICTALHEGRQLMNEVVPMHVDHLFTLLFTASKFYLNFHQQRRTTDLSQTEWSHNSGDGTKTRCIKLTAALNQTVGPKSTQVCETQTMLSCCKEGFLYAIDMESNNVGIPYADSFYIVVHFCLHKVTDNESSIAIYAQIKYKKSVWGFAKSIIERNCWAGLEDFYSSLAVALHAEVEDSMSNIDKKKKRVKPRSRIVQRNSLERPPNRSGSVLKPTVPAQTGYKPDLATIVVFGVLILLVILNILLYYKLWSLEESPPYSIMDLHLIKNPPNNPDDWLKLLRQQEVLHSVEMQKWQQILKTAIKLLKQTEESLNELQKSIHPAYTSKLMSVLQSQKDGATNKQQDSVLMEASSMDDYWKLGILLKMSEIKPFKCFQKVPKKYKEISEYFKAATICARHPHCLDNLYRTQRPGLINILQMACLGDCWDLLGPPPDSILSMPPPPPLPSFMQGPTAAAALAPPLLAADLLLLLPSVASSLAGNGNNHNSTISMCSAPNLCELVGGSSADGHGAAISGQFNNHGHDGGSSGGNGYVEMPRKEVESWAMSGFDDTWLLVLVASSIGVLLLGALLAMFLLKCREMNIFSNNDCSMHDRDNNHHSIHRQLKAHHEVREVQTANNSSFTPNTKLVHPSETVLYHHNGPTAGSLHPVMDNRMVWAALTPRGTQHFFSAEDSYDPTDDMTDYGPEVEDHYETIDALTQQSNQIGFTTYGTYQKEYEYEDPAPFIETYEQHAPSCNMNTIANNNRNQHHHHHHKSKHNNHSSGSSAATDYTSSSTGASTLSGGNTDMRCAASILLNGLGTNASQHQSNGGTVKRHGHGPGTSNSTLYRPRVSEPTRIENPNLPPLNLMFQPGGQQMQQLTTGQGGQQLQQSRGNTLKKNGSNSNGTLQLSQIGSYRNGGGDTLPKFA